MKEKAIKILRIAQIGVAILLFCLIFFGINDTESGIILPNSIFYLPIGIFAIFIGLFIAEFALKRGNIRAIAYFIEAIFCIGFFIQDDHVMAVTFLMIAGFPNAIVTVVSYIRSFNDKPDFKTLPLGFYSELHFYAVYGSISLMIGILILLYFVFEKYQINMAYILISIPVIIVVMFFVMIKFNPLVKAFASINKELNYEKYSHELDALFPNNLHPESRAYLEAARANYMLLDNKDEAMKYYETISTVTSRQFIVPYSVIKCNFSAMRHDKQAFENSLSMISTYGGRTNPGIIKKVNSIWMIYNSKEEIEDIEQIYGAYESMPVSRIINKETLMIYYKTRGNMDKAMAIANELKDCPFNQYKKEALEILEGEKNEK